MGHGGASLSRAPRPTSQVTPSQPVIINLDQALARDNPPLRTVNPLRVTAGGLRLTGYCPGQLHAWVRLTTGTWLGFCSFVAHSGNHRATSSYANGYPPAPSPHTSTSRHHRDVAVLDTARTAPPRHRTLWRGARRPRTPGCLRGEGG